MRQPTAMASWDWAIDWQAPWLAPLQALGRQVHEQVLGGAGVARALQEVAAAHGLLPGWQFVDQLQLPAGEAYEAFIHSRRCIPTRDNLHDFFNGLIWLHWPLLKQRLNALQAAEIARQGVGAQRGRLRDSITAGREWRPAAGASGAVRCAARQALAGAVRGPAGAVAAGAFPAHRPCPAGKAGPAAQGHYRACDLCTDAAGAAPGIAGRGRWLAGRSVEDPVLQSGRQALSTNSHIGNPGLVPAKPELFLL